MEKLNRLAMGREDELYGAAPAPAPPSKATLPPSYARSLAVDSVTSTASNVTTERYTR